MTPVDRERLDAEIEQLEWEIGWKKNDLAQLKAKRYRATEYPLELLPADRETNR